MASRSNVVVSSVRLPVDLHRQLAEIARLEERTLNAQIVYVVRCWLADQQVVKGEDR